MRRSGPNITLDDLPMFATDQQIAEAIVGRAAAPAWLRDRLPTLASKPGFPKIDAFHGGRPVPLVKRFYEQYLQIVPAGAVDGPEDEGSWTRSRRRG